MKLKLLVLALLSFCSTHLFAHAMWIETNPAGIKGKPQEVKIFFGEYADKDITPSAKWFSDIKDFSLVVIGPDRKEIKLSATAKEKFYSATLTPAEDGVYTLVMHHIVKDTYGSMKLDYNSSATVTVGNQLNGNDANANNNVISLFNEAATTAKQNTLVKIKAVYDGKPAAKHEMKVFAPNGWGKELYSNDEGHVSFTPIWPGKYMAEFAYTDKTPGEHNGKKYEEVWKVATYIINVK